MRSKFKWIFTLLVAFTMQFSFAQQKTVTGTVMSDGAALPGATVSIAGTQQGTQTNENGKFSIKAAQGDVLEISFLGKETKSVTVGAGNVVNVTLVSKENVIEPIVLVSGAVGIKKKKDAVTSSYQTISAKEITVAANPDPVRSLIGKVSGLTINATTNGVAGDNAIRLRTMTSLTGNTQALVVIDDVISTATVFSSLTPDAIQNVTVLKGVQGAALYGAQGKNGVIVVTTKKGGNGEKLSVSLNSSVDFENINFIPLRQEKYGQGWFGTRFSDENGGWGELFDGAPHQVGFPDANGNVIVTPYSSRGNDVIKDFYTTGVTYQNSINVGMSGKDSYANVNLGNYRRDFILEGDTFNRNNIIFSMGKKFNKLSVDAVVNYSNSRTKQANVNAATTRSDYTLLTTLLQTASNVPVYLYKDRGLYGWNSYYQNPFWAKENNRLFEDRNFFSVNLKPKYEFNKNISAIINNSIQFDTRNQTSYANEGAFIDGGGALTDGEFQSASSFYQSEFTRLYYYGDFMLNFKYDLTDNIGLSANLGQNIQYSRTNRISQGGLNFDLPGWYNIQNVQNPDLPSTLDNRRFASNLAATFANVDLNYKDYLFLNATARYEGNSVGVQDNKWFFYPSVGVSYIPSKGIAALKDKSTFSSSKVFANLTQVGSLDPVSPYEVIPVASLANNFPYPNGSGNSYNDLTSIASPNLKPEMYTTFEVGTALGFFNDRIMLEGSYFNTKTKDLITSSTYSSTTGLGSVLSNAGNLTANGFEIDLSFQPIKTENFSWTGRASYTTNKTVVDDAGETSAITLYGGNGSINFNIGAEEGEEFPLIKGSDWLRDSNGNIIVNAITGAPTENPTLKVLGQATPDYILNLTNTFVYKGFGLSFTADFRTGHSFISQTKYNLTWNGHLYESGELDRANGWILENSVIDNPATPTVGDYIPNTSVLTGGFYTAGGAANRTQTYWGTAAGVGSENIVDATSLRIREIALSYELPKKVISRAGLASLKFSVNARNPFVFLADGGLIKAKNGGENRGYADPEANSLYNQSTSTAARRAGGTMNNTAANSVGFIGDGQYPSTKTFGFSLNATF